MKIVVLNDSFLKDAQLERLKKLGEVEINLQTTTEQQVIEKLKNADVAIADMFEAPLNGKVFNNIPSVKFISINSTGFDLVDTKSAREHGIKVSNVPGFGTQGVAEHTLALMFAVAHKVVLGDKAMRVKPFQIDPANREHDKFLATNLSRKTIGIIGLGQIGTQVGQMASALGMKVLATNRSVKNVPNIKLVDLEELLKQSDIVSLNGALSTEQEHLISENTLKLMKKSAILINTARGGFIDDNALAKALSENRIAGAGLDFLDEWTEENPLIKLDNVVLTPHTGWFTDESLENMADIITGNVEAFIAGKPRNIINAE